VVADQRVTIAEITASGLLDAAWYLDRHPDVRAACLDPLEHFCRYGWRENRAPNPWFDPEWYLAQNPDVAAAGLNPLLHYIHHGESEGRQPTAYFDPSWYRTAYALRADVSPLIHYINVRKSRRFSPCERLYAAPFLPEYAVGNSAIWSDPYLECREAAKRDSRVPTPDVILVERSGLLDPNYYLINGGDVRGAALNPIEHFCRYGWREQRKPNIHFHTEWYAETNPIVKRMKINPLLHYIAEGEAAGRRPAIYFDPFWYRTKYREALQTSKLCPLAHYLAYRRTQEFSPNGHFDVAWYVDRYRAELGPNREPFAHYLQMGTTQDLNPSPSFDAASYRRRNLGRISRAFRHTVHPDRDNPLVHYLRRQYS
jgi:hypothetical protein